MGYGGYIAETLGDYYSIQSHHIIPNQYLQLQNIVATITINS